MTKDAASVAYDVAGRAVDFTRKLYQCCEGVVDYSTGRDPWHDPAQEIIAIMYQWLYENGKITLSSPFSAICNLINSYMPYFFTLDMSECSELTNVRYNNLCNAELRCLSNERHRLTVLSNLRVVYDLTCAGELLGEDIDY